MRGHRSGIDARLSDAAYALSTTESERIRYRQGYLMRRGHLPEGFERFNAL